MKTYDILEVRGRPGENDTHPSIISSHLVPLYLF